MPTLHSSPTESYRQLKVLVVEDDPNTRDILRMYLERAGYELQAAADGDTGLRLARRIQPDLIVLDLMLPGMDGWEVCRNLREWSDVPILILSARQEEQDRLLGLGLGADDYVVKPFSPREVVLRVQAILRRMRPRRNEAELADPLVRGPIEIDSERHVVSAYGREVTLTPSEFKLLLALMQTPGKTFDRRELLDHLYPMGGSVVPKVVDVHIGKLRHKIEPVPAHPRHVITVRGFGYRFSTSET